MKKNEWFEIGVAIKIGIFWSHILEYFGVSEQVLYLIFNIAVWYSCAMVIFYYNDIAPSNLKFKL
jgi:hypothetical protein